MEPYDVCREGAVYTYSVVHEAPEANRAMRPYVVAMVRTDDGVMVTSQVTDVDPQEVRIGMRVRAVLRRLDSDGPAGIIHYGYKFVPVR